MRWRALAVLLLSGCPPSGLLPDGGKPPCVLVATPEYVDFGEVDTFDRATRRVRITNRSEQFVEVDLGPLEAPFAALQQRRFPIGPFENIGFDVTFDPLDGLLHFTELVVDGRGCSVTVPLRGLGGGAVIASPSPLNFGGLEPGQSKTLQLTISNGRRVPVIIDGLGILNHRPEFTYLGPPLIELPSLGATTVSVTASPTSYTHFSGRLVGSTSFEELSVPLELTGGVPIAQVTPATLDVPKVALNSSWERELKVRNVASDAGASFFSPLLLSPARPFTVERLDGGATTELVVNFFDSRVFGGIIAGAEAVVRVRMVPDSLGPRDYRLTLFTNDPVQPEHVVTISTRAAMMPECQFVMSAPIIMLTPRAGVGTEGWFSFRNTGTTNCTLDDVRMRTGSDPAVRITDGGVNQLVLLPGEEHVVTFEGPDAGGFPGELSYQVFNPYSRRQSVALQFAP